MIQHRDRPHDHAHIIASSVSVNGEKINMWQCKQRVEEILREIEVKHNLTCVTSSRETLRAAPKRNETAMLESEGRKSIKLTLQERVDEALSAAPNVGAFLENLKACDVRVIPFFESQRSTKNAPDAHASDLRNENPPEPEKVVGICFETGGEVMKGSSLGRGFSWNALQARGLDYQLARDELLLREVKAETEAYLENRKAAAPAVSSREAAPVEMPGSIDTAENVFVTPGVSPSLAGQTCRTVAVFAEKAAPDLSAEIVFEPVGSQDIQISGCEAESDVPVQRNMPALIVSKVIEDERATNDFESNQTTENGVQLVSPAPNKSTEIDKSPAVQSGTAAIGIGEESDLAGDEPLPENPAAGLSAPVLMQTSSASRDEPEQLPEVLSETGWQPSSAPNDDYFDDWYYLEYEKLIRAQIDENDLRVRTELAKQQEINQQTAAATDQQSIELILQNFRQHAEVEFSAQTENIAQIQKSELLPPAERFSNSADYSPIAQESSLLPSDAEIHARLALAVGIEPESEREELAAEKGKSDEQEKASRQNQEQSLAGERDAEEKVQAEVKVKMQGKARTLELGFEI